MCCMVFRKNGSVGIFTTAVQIRIVNVVQALDMPLHIYLHA